MSAILKATSDIDRARHSVYDKVEIARNELAANAIEVDRRGKFPTRNFDVLKELGLLGLTVPASHGGSGLGPYGDMDAYVHVITRLGSACSSTAQCLNVHLSTATTAAAVATPAQQAFIYDQMLQGRLFGSAGSEPGQKRTVSGNAVRRGTLLTRAENGYILNGKKFFSTNSAAAQWLVVFATLEVNGTDHTVNVLVDRDDPGVSIEDSWDAMGQRGTASGVVVLHNVPIAADRLLGEDPFAFSRATQLPAHYQAGFAILHHAIAEGAFGFLKHYIEHHAVGSVDYDIAGQDPLIALLVGDLGARLQASRVSVSHAARLVQNLFQNGGEPRAVAHEVGMAKDTAINASLDIGTRLFDVCGARAVASRFAADRFWRNARTLSLHDSRARRQVGLGLDVFGLDAKTPEGVRVQFTL